MSTILITVDLEDWFQVENLRSLYPLENWHKCQVRVEQSTEQLLELFHRYEVKATFFVLGWLAERLPELVKRIKNMGHEIASHGYNHILCSEQDKGALLEDIKKSKQILEDIISEPVIGYRAPSFSITQALVSGLEEAGFTYDSSYNDFHGNSRYGSLPGCWKTVKPGLLINEQGLYEIPISNIKFFGKIFPWGGGGYFRLIPGPLFQKGVKKITQNVGAYVFYCHPWEFDPEQPKVKGLRPDLYLKHYVNLARSLNKLREFLRVFVTARFLTCSQFLTEGCKSPTDSTTIGYI